jgi:glycerophosphoryl diester phosphodiesterase
MTSSRARIIWLCVNSITTALLVVFLSVALLVEPNWVDISSFLSDASNLRFNYVLAIVCITLIPLAYSFWRTYKSLKAVAGGQTVRVALVNELTPIMLIIVYGGILALLVALWGEDGVLVLRAIEYLSPVIFWGSTSVLIVASYLILPWVTTAFRKLRGPMPQRSFVRIAALALLVLGYGFVLAAPFLLVPSNVGQGSLPDKPLLIAHRGGSSLGPENTIEAAETSLSFGIRIIEIDVQISLDGVPFLLHDDTLARTTDVAERYPGNETKVASSFIISQLRQLDAGSWFAELDPYSTIASGVVSPTLADSYRGAMIPTLVEALDFVKANGLLLDVDFKTPPSSHPFYSQYFNVCLSLLHGAGIDQQVWIATANEAWLNYTESVASQMVSALGVEGADAPSVSQFHAMGYDMLNSHHGLSNDILRNYEAGGVILNAWTVNSVFRYSQLWCLGVDYVTTDYPQSFSSMTQPVWYLPLPSYEALWLAEYAIGFTAVVFLYRRK